MPTSDPLDTIKRLGEIRRDVDSECVCDGRCPCCRDTRALLDLIGEMGDLLGACISGVEPWADEDPRMDYVTAQIGKDVLADARRLIAALRETQ